MAIHTTPMGKRSQSLQCFRVFLMPRMPQEEEAWIENERTVRHAFFWHFMFALLYLCA